MLVDDDAELLELAAGMLVSEGGMTVDTASTGDAALDKLGAAQYDAVVADYVMPGMNGIDLLRNARARGYLNTFLVFTGRGNEEVALDAILNGADHYLPKTGRASQDIALIRSILQKRQKRAEEEKERRSEAAYHSLLMRMHDGFAYHRIIYGEGGRPVSSMIIDANDAFEHTFAAAGDSVVGRDVRLLISDAEGFERDLLKAFEDIATTGKEVQFVRRSAPLDRWFSVAMYAPEPGHFVTILSDITAQKKMEEELELARKKLYLLGSITRHDLLNQLTSLNGYLGIAQYKLGDNAMAGYLDKALRSGEHMRKILEFSRDYERMGSQRSEWYQAQEVAEKGVTEAQLQDAEVSIELRGVEILADRMVEKVFHNLADNAVRHGKATRVRFSYESGGEDLKIVCQDNGAGVAPEKRDEMFDDRFGHGLYLVKEVLKMTGMSIEETSPPKGARFEITVPRGGYRLNK